MDNQINNTLTWYNIKKELLRQYHSFKMIEHWWSAVN